MPKKWPINEWLYEAGFLPLPEPEWHVSELIDARLAAMTPEERAAHDAVVAARKAHWPKPKFSPRRRVRGLRKCPFCGFKGNKYLGGGNPNGVWVHEDSVLCLGCGSIFTKVSGRDKMTGARIP